MKIIMLTTHLNAGGITSYILILARGLIKQGHKVFVASAGGEMEEEFQKSGAALLYLPIKTKSELSPLLWLSLPKLLRFIKTEKMDVIHSHTRVSQVLGWAAGKLAKKRYVTTCHGFFRPRFFRRVWHCWGDRAIAISDAVSDHLINDFAVPKERVVKVLTGIELGKFRVWTVEERSLKREEMGVRTDKLIGMIARLSEVKGQDIMINAMPMIKEKVPSARLVILGEGKIEWQLRELVKNLGLSEHVYFLPMVGKTPEMLGIMDIVVSPSRSEGLGITVMEAQACGLPVVASGIGGLVDLIENEKTGLLVPPEDPHELAKAVIRIFEDANLASRLGKAARERAVKEYGSDQMIKKITAAYNCASK